MMTRPSWLPELFETKRWDHSTYDMLYRIFCTDFIDSKTHFCEKHVSIPKDLEDGKHKTFWHVTTRDDKGSGQRLPDLRRCERLPWLKPLLENPTKPEVLAWEFMEDDGSVNIYVWLKDQDYIAIIKKTKKGYLILRTAYWVEYGNTKKKLMKKYDSRNKKANA